MYNCIVCFKQTRTLVDNKKELSIGFDGHTQYTFSKESAYAAKCFLSNKDSWPTAAQMNLDASQYEAVQLALENKLTLIQGPPGTGKTFIGVKLVQLLLHNKHTWWNKPNERHRPILMICYTNHALDQFLEFCINECQLKSGVVRVGGRSKCESLEPFLLSTIKQKLRAKRAIDPKVYQRIREQRGILRAIQYKINFADSLVDLAKANRIIAFAKLKKYMTDEHLSQLVNYNSKLNGLNRRANDDFTLLEWLGLLRLEDFNG